MVLNIQKYIYGRNNQNYILIVFVPNMDIGEIVEQLFTVYSKCVVFDRPGNKIEVTK